MNHIKKILPLAVLLMVMIGPDAFTAVQKTSDKETSTSSTASAPGSSGPTVGESPSILYRVQNPPEEPPPNAPQDAPTPPDCVPGYPNCPTTPDPNCIPGYPNCPTTTTPTAAEVVPIYNVCPQGYYCRATLIPVLGARERWDGTCTINESELDETFRDCAKVAEFCQGPQLPESKVLYKKLCESGVPSPTS